MVIFDDYDFPMLLGRKGFFDQFLITIDEKTQKVNLKKNQSREF
jgi:hypothetical protein